MGLPTVELSPLAQVLLAANVAWALGFSARRLGWTWSQCAGLGLVLYPFLHVALQVFLAVPTINAGLEPAPFTDADIRRNLQNAFVYRILFPIAGLLLIFRGRLARVGRFLRLPRGHLSTDATDAQALFGFAAILYAIGFYAVPLLLDADEASGGLGPLADLTPLGALLLSLSAGVSEELLFRGILQRWLQARWPWSLAVGGQALLFGLSHLTYGSVIPVLAATALGILTGLVAWRLGLLAAILLHAQFDLLHFAFRLVDPALLGLCLFVSLLGLVLLAATRARALRLLLAPLPAWTFRPPPEAA